MTITVQIPATLRAYCHEARTELILSATTVRDALLQLEQSHAPLYQSICDETGAVRRHIHLFVNNTFIHERDGLDTAFAQDDILSIMPAVSGG